MFIPALKQTIFPIRSKLLVYNRQHLFSKSHIYRSPSLRFTEAPTSNPLGKRWRSLSRFPWKTASSGTSNAVAASARYHATSPSSLIKSRVPSTHVAENHDFISSDHGSRSSTSKSLFCSARSGNMPSTGAMHSRFDRSAVARKSAVSTRWFLRLALLPVSSCASLHSFSSLLVFWIPVFQVLWISIACLGEIISTRDYWAVTFFHVLSCFLGIEKAEFLSKPRPNSEWLCNNVSSW